LSQGHRAKRNSFQPASLPLQAGIVEVCSDPQANVADRIQRQRSVIKVDLVDLIRSIVVNQLNGLVIELVGTCLAGQSPVAVVVPFPFQAVFFFAVFFFAVFFFAWSRRNV
jgi:hypothetical protein